MCVGGLFLITPQVPPDWPGLGRPLIHSGELAAALLSGAASGPPSPSSPSRPAGMSAWDPFLSTPGPSSLRFPSF